MNTQPDFEELLKLLEKNKVRYMVIGGYAVAFHGYSRFTKDIDVFYDHDAANIAKLRKVLVEFGFREDEMPEKVFTEKGSIIKFGIEPVRVDLLNDIAGVIFKKAVRHIIKGKFGKTTINFIGKADLIANKTIVNRPQDRLDIEKLT